MSFYNKKGRSIGRVLHFLYHYCGLNIAETVQVGDGFVRLYGESFATFDWIEDDIPVFTFTCRNRDIYEKNQILNMEDAIEESKLALAS